MNGSQATDPGERQSPPTIIYLSIIVAIIASILTVVLLYVDAGSPKGSDPVEAAVLTVRAEQEEIDRQGRYLRSEAALGAYEPELGPFLIEGGLDQVEVESDGPFLSIEYGDGGSTIRLDYLDWNLVNVTCVRIDRCPSAAELIQQAQVQTPVLS